MRTMADSEVHVESGGWKARRCGLSAKAFLAIMAVTLIAIHWQWCAHDLGLLPSEQVCRVAAIALLEPDGTNDWEYG